MLLHTSGASQQGNPSCNRSAAGVCAASPLAGEWEDGIVLISLDRSRSGLYPSVNALLVSEGKSMLTYPAECLTHAAVLTVEVVSSRKGMS